jgi:hypothetical protein
MLRFNIIINILLNLSFIIILVNANIIGSNGEYGLNFHSIYIEFGKNLGEHVPSQILKHLNNVEHIKVYDYNEYINLKNNNITIPIGSLLISLGNTTNSLNLLNNINNLPFESFEILSNIISESNNYNISNIVSNGSPLDIETHSNVSFNTDRVHYGAVLGAYTALELLGFSFSHPLEPYIPSILRIDYQQCTSLLKNITLVNNINISYCNINVIESPHWPERGFHIHTQHPLEVTEVLNGHDIPQFGPFGSNCITYRKQYLNTEDKNKDYRHPHPKAKYCERWEDMIQDVNSMFEWAIANRLNKVEWLLLGNTKKFIFLLLF